MKDATALEALQRAVRNEQDGLNFYRNAVVRTGDPQGKRLFRSLADDEERHLRILQAQREAVVAGRWAAPQELAEELVSSATPVDLEKPLFPPGRAVLEKMVRQDASDLDAVVLALTMENDAYDLYLGAMAATSDPGGRAMYQYLASAEREHFEVLMLNYEHLANGGGWLGREETGQP